MTEPPFRRTPPALAARLAGWPWPTQQPKQQTERDRLIDTLDRMGIEHNMTKEEK